MKSNVLELIGAIDEARKVFRAGGVPYGCFSHMDAITAKLPRENQRVRDAKKTIAELRGALSAGRECKPLEELQEARAHLELLLVEIDRDDDQQVIGAAVACSG